jgi:hypothetical protein
MRYDPDACREHGNWATAGWWSLQPGEQFYLFSTNNRYAAFYADADDGAFWAGEYGPVYVYYDPFDSCVGIGSTGAYGTVGMRLLDTNGSDVIVNLTE